MLEQETPVSLTEPILLRATVLIGAIEDVEYFVIVARMPVSYCVEFPQS